MQLTQTQISKFQKIYKKRFSVDLSEDEAKEKGLKLIEFVRAVYRPKPPSLSKPPRSS